VGEDGFLSYLVTRVAFAVRKLEEPFSGILPCVRLLTRARCCAGGGGCRPVAAVVAAKGCRWGGMWVVQL